MLPNSAIATKIHSVIFAAFPYLQYSKFIIKKTKLQYSPQKLSILFVFLLEESSLLEGVNRLSNKDEQTTDTEENAIAAPAAAGGSWKCTRGKNRPAASGMQTQL